MKRNFIFFAAILLVFATGVQAQHAGWLKDLKFAQTLAQSSNKLILVDFWATWCGPCKQMDADLWSTQEAAAIKKNFVPVKIDIDAEKSLAVHYNVRSIPMLILMDHKGEVLHTYVGYSGKQHLLDFVSNIPSDATQLYNKIPADDSKETFDQTRSLGLAMQELSQQTTYEPLQRSFMAISDKWFKRSTKLAGDDVNKVNEIELLGNISDIQRGRTKKVIKELEESRTKFENTPNESLMYFVFVQAYKKNGDDAGYKYAVSKLQEREDGKRYLSLLK